MPRKDAGVQHSARQGLLVLLLLLLFSLVSCHGMAGAAPSPGQSPTAVAPLLIPSSSPPVAAVSPGVDQAQCAYVWANQDLPEVAESLRKILQEAGLADIQAHASAFGENCIDPTTGSLVRFLPMQTDFRFVILVESIDDAQELGEWIEKILPILDSFPPGQVPGPNSGIVLIQFQGKSAEKRLLFPLSKAQALLRDALNGSALYRALENQ